MNTTLFVRDFRENLPIFAYYFLQYLDLTRFGSGTGVPTLNRNDIHPLDIMYPQRAEQERISETLVVSDQEIAVVESLLEQLKDQKRGLMQQLLAGAIRVQVDE